MVCYQSVESNTVYNILEIVKDTPPTIDIQYDRDFDSGGGRVGIFMCVWCVVCECSCVCRLCGVKRKISIRWPYKTENCAISDESDELPVSIT